MGIELRNALETALDRPLPATIAWSYPTVRALGAHLAAIPAAETEAPETTYAAGGASEIEIEMVGAMSDDEALAALRRGRR